MVLAAKILETGVAILILATGFRLLELTRPRHRRLRFFRRGLRTDVAYLVFTPLITKIVERIVLLLAIVPAALLVYGVVDKDLILGGFGPLGRLPYPLQAVLILATGDFLGYWMHRAFHRGRLWRYHAIHHSSIDLDWLSSVRTHPANDLIQRLATTLPLVLLGFAPAAVAGVLPVLTLFAIMLHANLDWDWGPLRTVIVSPRFHRWHHTDEAQARDKNFSGLLPIWDLLFGTYYMPKDRLPERFGTLTEVPASLAGQMLFPFRRATRSPVRSSGPN